MAPRADETPTLLGKGSDFDGKLTFEGEVRIDGKFNGQINTKDTLIIGETATVSGDIFAGTIIVHGSFEGNLYASGAVELHKPGKVRGKIETPAIEMDRGFFFEGSVKMENLGAQAKKSA